MRGHGFLRTVSKHGAQTLQPHAKPLLPSILIQAMQIVFELGPSAVDGQMPLRVVQYTLMFVKQKLNSCNRYQPSAVILLAFAHSRARTHAFSFLLMRHAARKALALPHYRLALRRGHVAAAKACWRRACEDEA
eukprot:TRINITY_DN11331_c0_g1_i3.p2 TRINITY_DN11331_c0_g1~~TRINITY_DN11331_c0_g1_i3.p2  ORF type:complete len:134 (-),score=16.78 TRINITY_DN11331_c0_g1_i3:63-464(-)